MTTKTTTAKVSGHCARCGRALTDPRSVAAGIGPKCAKRIAAQAKVIVATHKPAQVAKAVELIGDGAIVRTGAHTFTVVNSNGVDRYTTTPVLCDCPAGTHGRTCYHRVAAQLIAA